MPTPARTEREALCDLFLAVGPDAPTLAGAWTTRDLAAHLVVRERRPDAALGILVAPFAAYAEKVRQAEAAHDYAAIVERVRSGPPLFSPMRPAVMERLVNTIEYFVHHEDVRRGSPGWEPRHLDADLERDLAGPFTGVVRLLARKAPAGIVLQPVGHDNIVAKRVGEGAPSVTASGPLGELVLFMYGRQANSVVVLDGPDVAVEQIREASFGF